MDQYQAKLDLCRAKIKNAIIHEEFKITCFKANTACTEPMHERVLETLRNEGYKVEEKIRQVRREDKDGHNHNISSKYHEISWVGDKDTIVTYTAYIQDISLGK